jgi:RNA recognition motif-containing protein
LPGKASRVSSLSPICGKEEGSDIRKNPRKEKTMLIYVWNLSTNVSEEFFSQTFEAFGQVRFAIISSTNLKDRDNGQSRRFGFVEMPDQAEAQAAIKNLNRKALMGRQMILYGSSEN